MRVHLGVKGPVFGSRVSGAKCVVRTIYPKPTCVPGWLTISLDWPPNVGVFQTVQSSTQEVSYVCFCFPNSPVSGNGHDFGSSYARMPACIALLKPIEQQFRLFGDPCLSSSRCPKFKRLDLDANPRSRIRTLPWVLSSSTTGASCRSPVKYQLMPSYLGVHM